MTGLDVATMLGDDFKNLYLKSKQRKEEMLQEEKNKYLSAFERICK